MSSSKKVIPSPAHHTKETVSQNTADSILFTKENFKWMVIGLIVMAIGFFLMAGGKSADPNVFNDNEIYSFLIITLASILIVTRLVIEILTILKKHK